MTYWKLESPYLGKLQQPQEQRYPFLSVRAVFSCVQTMVWLPVFGIFNMHTDVDACDCSPGMYGHRKRVCTGSWLWEKNPLPQRGLEPVSVLRLTLQSDALPTELSRPLQRCFRSWWVLASSLPWPSRCSDGSIWNRFQPHRLFTSFLTYDTEYKTSSNESSGLMTDISVKTVEQESEYNTAKRTQPRLNMTALWHPDTTRGKLWIQLLRVKPCFRPYYWIV